MKRILLHLLLSITILVFSLAALEATAQIYMRGKHRLREHEAMIEQQGFTPDNKKPGEKRIMVVGESAARGVPYGMELSFSGFLQQLLNVAGYEKVKVVNIGIPGHHSFYHKEQKHALVRYHSDAVILYAGNNDTRDFSMVMRDVPLAWLDFRLTWSSYFYWGLKRKWMAFKRWANEYLKKDIFNINYNPDDVWHWTDGYLRKKKKYLDHPALGLKRKEQALRDYEKNMDDVVAFLKSNGLSVFITNLPIVHEWPPQIGDWSRKGFDFKQKVWFRNQNEGARWQELFESGEAALKASDFENARSLFERAREINDTYPMLFHHLGRAYAGLADHQQAKEMYVRGKDVQIQSPGGDSHKTAILRRIASKNDAHWINPQGALEEISPNERIGKNLFLDHCHPNFLGHKVIASRVMQGLCESDFIRCEPEETTWKHWLRQLIGGEINHENLAREYLLVAFYKFKGTDWEPTPNYEQAIEYLEKARSIKPGLKGIYPFLAAAYWKNGKKGKAKSVLNILSSLDQMEYERTFEDFPYLESIRPT